MEKGYIFICNMVWLHYVFIKFSWQNQLIHELYTFLLNCRIVFFYFILFIYLFIYLFIAVFWKLCVFAFFENSENFLKVTKYLIKSNTFSALVYNETEQSTLFGFVVSWRRESITFSQLFHNVFLVNVSTKGTAATKCCNCQNMHRYLHRHCWMPSWDSGAEKSTSGIVRRASCREVFWHIATLKVFENSSVTARNLITFQKCTL